MRYSSIIFGCLIFGLFLSLPLRVRAFSVSPLRYVINAEAGATQQLRVTITNPDAVSAHYALQVVGVRQDATGRPIFENSIDSAETWVEPSQPSITLRGKEEATAIFSLHIPKQALPGAHYLGLAVEASGGGNGTALRGRLVTLVVLHVAGEVHENVEIIMWRGPTWITQSAWPFSLSLRNRGTIEVPLEGYLQITNWSGKELARNSVTLGNPLVPGGYRTLEPTIDTKGQIRWPGWYRAELLVHYGKTKQIVTAKITLWYIPLWVFGIIGTICFGLIWRAVGRRSQRRPTSAN